MSFQAYLDTIKAKTGKDPADFRELALAKGLVGPKTKAGDVFKWLEQDFGLGRGHAMALYTILKADGAAQPSAAERLESLFAGKAATGVLYDDLFGRAQAFGDDVGADATDTYVSLLRGTKKFAVAQPAVKHMDVGIKRKGVAPTDRFAVAGSWNGMVTHRVRVTAAADLDAELMAWLREAYDAAK